MLATLDAAKTQWYHHHFMLGCIYYTDLARPEHGTQPPNAADTVNGVVFCNALAGQFFFGWLGNRLGRNSVYGGTLLHMAICSLASSSHLGACPPASFNCSSSATLAPA